MGRERPIGIARGNVSGDRNNKGQFVAGWRGGPGRQKGYRAKLAEKATQLLFEDFEQYGEETIRRVREQKPERYLEEVLKLAPKQTEKLESPFSDLTDVELMQLEELLAGLRAKTVREIEAHNGAIEPEPQKSEPIAVSKKD